MQKKSLSEKIAHVFEIVGYFLLIPAIPIVVVSAIFVFPLLVSVPVFAIGLTLFIGYIKHSRGTLSKGKTLPLWITTFLFNFLPLLFLTNEYFFKPAETFESPNFFFALLIFWWIIACCLSLTAFYNEFFEKRFN